MTPDYRHEPYAHQREVFETRGLDEVFALFWEQGTGKTKGIIDQACALCRSERVDAMLVLAPDGVHANWVVEELPAHVWASVPYRALAYRTSRAGTKRQEREFDDLVRFDGFAVLTMSYDAAVTDRGKKVVWDFLRKRRVLFALDESHKIKTPSADRTKRVLKMGPYARYRRIASGTPTAGSPFDVYSQMRFLDPDVWLREGIGNFTAFKHEFAVLNTFWRDEEDGRYRLATFDEPMPAGTKRSDRFTTVAEYRNLDRLHAIIDRMSSRVLKEDVLDLPEKTYQRRTFEMSPEQSRLYRDVRDECLAILESGEMITTTLAITKLLRLQQIACGYVATDDGTEVLDIPGPNRRLNLLREIADDVGKGNGHIVWCRFQADVDRIVPALRTDGFKVASYDGRSTDKESDFARRAIQDGSIDKMVCNLARSEGWTATRAQRATYYNNSFNLIHRLQSEDRIHRIGQRGTCLYDDLLAEGTVDEKTLDALRKKLNVASQITGDNLKEWLA